MTEFCRFCCCVLFCVAAVACAVNLSEGLKALGAGIAVSNERSTNAYFDRQERLMGETLQQLRRPGIESEDG